MGSGNRRNPATGRKHRESVNKPGWEGKGGPKRYSGRIVPKGRLEYRRQQSMRPTQEGED